MKLKNRLFIFTILYLCIVIFNADAQQLTLKESIESGLRNSKELIISKSRIISSEEKIREFGSQMLPQLKLSASYTRLSDIPPFQITVPISPNPIKISDPVLNSTQIKISLQQPLFTGLRLSSLKNSAEFNYQSSTFEHDANVNEYAYRIQEAFWNFYNAQKVVDLVNEQLRSLNNSVNDTKNFLENGLVSLNDLLKLEVQQSNTELKLLEVKNLLSIARMNFNRLIGLPLKNETSIKADDLYEGLTTYNEEEIFSEAKLNRNELKALEKKILASDEQITSSNSAWFPSVYLFGDFYYANPNQRIFPQKNQFDDSWDVGLALNWDLFDWGLTSSKSIQAEQLKIQAETSYSQLNEAVEIEVYQAYLNYLKSYDKINVSEKAEDQAKENYRITKEKYDVQLATSSELIDANVYLLQAQTNQINARVEFKLAKAKLEKAIGRKIY